MGFDQYHEPPDELPHETRTFARMITSLIEEAEAISWYEQRMAVERDKQAKAIMANAQKEEFKHFGMNLEFLLRRNKDWRTELRGILFTEGDIVKRAEEAETKVDCTLRRSLLAGQPAVGQLAPFDLLVLLILSETVQNSLIGDDTS